MSDRRILPQRRASYIFDLRDQGLTVSYSTFDTGDVGEIFVTSRKIGSDAEAVARDAAILLSLAVQYGCPISTIQHALTRNSDGTPQSLMGRVIDRVVQEVER